MLVPMWLMWSVVGLAVVIAVPAIERLVRRRGKPWLKIVALVAAGVIAFVITNAPTALVVSDAATGLEIVTERVLGTPDGAGPDCRPKSTWIVNRSHRPLRVERVEYGQELIHGAPDVPLVIAPGTACSTHDVDYLGPDHPPPKQVPLAGDEARLQSGTRTWLTW